MNDKIREFKLECEDGFAVEYSTVPINFELDKRRKVIEDGIASLDELIDKKNIELEKLNGEIDRLTNHADWLDYTVAVASGVIAGLVDSFVVGETELDKDKIQKFLEKKYHTANDSGYKHTKDKNIDNSAKWIDSAMYHRLDDLAHHPSIAGLVASIFVRYFRLVIFIDGSDGKPHIFFADTSSPEVTAQEKKELIKAWVGAIIGGLCVWLSNMAIKKYEEVNGSNMPDPLKKLVRIIGASPLILEIFKAVDVWLGHMMSDVSTSQGIPGIILSLLKEISVLPILRNTDFKVWVDGLYSKGNMNLSEWGGVIFTAAKKQSLPVLINETIVRCFFFIRHLAEELKDKKNIKDVNWNKVLPFRNRTIVRMLTISTGTFVAFDIADAAIRSGGFNAACVLRINFVGVGRFAIAIGADIVIGIKRSNKVNERSRLYSEITDLYVHKLYYREADLAYSLSELYSSQVEICQKEQSLWNEVAKTESDIRDLYSSIENTIIVFSASIQSMNETMHDIATDIDKLEGTDPEFVNQLRNRLKRRGVK